MGASPLCAWTKVRPRRASSAWVSLCVLFLAAFPAGALSLPGEGSVSLVAGRDVPLTHRPAEMILRFRDDSLLSETASRLAATGQSFQSLVGDSYPDEFNVTFKVRRFERLLDDKPEDGLGQGPITVEAARALLRETKAARDALANRLGKEFPRRSSRAPAVAAVPSLSGLYRVEFEDPKTDVPAACAAYARDPQVLYAQPNHLNQLYFSPDDPYCASAGSWGQPYDDLWGMKKLNPEPAWDLTRGEGAIVAVLDSGIDYTAHRNFLPRREH